MAKAPAEESDDPRQLAAQFDLIQRELQRMDRRLASLEQALIEAQQAATTVKGLAQTTGIQESLLPIGGGVHVHATIDAAKPVLLPIGAGYFTEDTAENVAGALEERVASITKSFQEASADAQRLAQAAANINERLADASPQ